MSAIDVAALVGAVLAIAGALGGVIRWTALKFDKQADKIDTLEREHAALFRTHSLVLVRLERFRLAFQMVAAELARKSPGNVALLHARALLDDSFKVEPDLPDDMQALLRKIDARQAEAHEKRPASGRATA